MKSGLFSVHIQHASTAPKGICTHLVLSEFVILIILSSFQLIIEISIFDSPSKTSTPLPHEDNTMGEQFHQPVNFLMLKERVTAQKYHRKIWEIQLKKQLPLSALHEVDYSIYLRVLISSLMNRLLEVYSLMPMKMTQGQHFWNTSQSQWQK